MPTGSSISTSSVLTELERQDRYLQSLPHDFEFPLFSGRQAVESQRRSGYKTTAHAARELVDNGMEAGAKHVWLALDRVSASARRKHQRKDAITAIAVIDDGPGMRPRLARYALSWGGGTHGDDPDFIARFGFGLPNSSINQTRRVEVYTKTVEADGWTLAVLDINDVPRFGLMSIPEPTRAPLPPFVRAYLDRKDIELASGTIVVWDRPDRLTYAQATVLSQHLVQDFGVTYRYLLDRTHIQVEDAPVAAVDPLFLTPGALLYVPPEEDGARNTFDKHLPVKYSRDDATGTPRLSLLESASDIEDARRTDGVTVGTIHVRIARFPYGFARGEKQFKGTDAYRRFQIRQHRRGISFVRADREIENSEGFPRSASDHASGLGDWPAVQTYAYHWGIEVRFGPELDEVFGIGNDKQTVRPIEDFWRVMTAAEADRAAREEDRHQRRIRERAKAEQSIVETRSPKRPNPATEAAAQAADISGRDRLPDERKQEAAEQVQREAEARVQQGAGTLDDAKAAIEEEARAKRYAIAFFEAEGGVFFRPAYGNGLQRVAQINKQHRFFADCYSRLARLEDPKPRQVVDLLLLALAQAELQSDGPKRITYEHERQAAWSPFLETSLKLLDQIEHRLEDEDEQT